MNLCGGGMFGWGGVLLLYTGHMPIPAARGMRCSNWFSFWAKCLGERLAQNHQVQLWTRTPPTRGSSQPPASKPMNGTKDVAEGLTQMSATHMTLTLCLNTHIHACVYGCFNIHWKFIKDSFVPRLLKQWFFKHNWCLLFLKWISKQKWCLLNVKTTVRVLFYHR